MMKLQNYGQIQAQKAMMNNLGPLESNDLAGSTGIPALLVSKLPLVTVSTSRIGHSNWQHMHCFARIN